MRTEQHIVKLYEPVHHRVLGVVLVATTIRQKQRCATFDGYVGLKLVDELPKLAIRPARFFGRDETIQDEQRRIMRPNLAPQYIDKLLDAVFLEDVEAVHVINTVGNTRPIKERHCLHVLHHAVVRFRQKGDVDRTVPGGGMIEA